MDTNHILQRKFTFSLQSTRLFKARTTNVAIEKIEYMAKPHPTGTVQGWRYHGPSGDVGPYANSPSIELLLAIIPAGCDVEEGCQSVNVAGAIPGLWQS